MFKSWLEAVFDWGGPREPRQRAIDYGEHQFGNYYTQRGGPYEHPSPVGHHGVHQASESRYFPFPPVSTVPYSCSEQVQGQSYASASGRGGQPDSSEAKNFHRNDSGSTFWSEYQIASLKDCLQVEKSRPPDDIAGEAFQPKQSRLEYPELRITDLEKNNGKLQNQIEIQEAALRERDGEVKALKKQLDNHRDCAGREVAAVKEKETRELKMLELRSENQELEVLTVTLRSEIKELTQSLEELKQRNSALEKQVRSKGTDLEETLRNKLAALNALNVGLRDKIHTLTTEIDEFRKYLEKLKRRNSELENQVGSKVSVPDATLLRSKDVAEIQSLREQLKEERQANATKLRELLQQRDLQIAELKRRNQKPEKQTPNGEVQQNREYAGGKSFLETEATPYLLDGAVQRVHEAASSFARLLIKTTEQGKLLDCKAAAQKRNCFSSPGKAAPLKYVYEAILCDVMFFSFEHDFYGLQNCSSACLDPEQHRRDNFSEFKDLRSKGVPEQIVLTPDNSFSDFCFTKLADLNQTIPELSSELEEIGNQAFVRSSSSRKVPTGAQSYPRAKFGITFLKLAQCVWQVHKLAFSFDPIARVFRPGQSETFVGSHMESVAMQDEESDDDENSSGWVAKVGFMVVPGFSVSRIVVRSRVYVI